MSGEHPGGYPYADAARREMQALIPRAARCLLDVGCGTGVFGAELRAARADVEVWGIDPADTVVATARANLDGFVHGLYPDAVLGDAALATRQFDCITFNDSLEHFVDPWDVLRQSKRLLSPGGTIVASIPNVRNYAVLRKLAVNGQWEYRETGILDRTHLRFFTRQSAIAMFADCGFVVTETHGLNVANHGRAVRALALLGSRTDEFRAMQFAYVARHA